MKLYVPSWSFVRATKSFALHYGAQVFVGKNKDKCDIVVNAHAKKQSEDVIKASTPQRLEELLAFRIATGPYSIYPFDMPLLWPVDSRRVTQKFGENPHMYAQWGLPAHEGVDIGEACGKPVRACAGGLVTTTATGKGYGLYVKIKTVGLDGKHYEFSYAHLSKIRVEEGAWLARGMVLGEVGNTGNSTGCHLHLTLRKQGATEDGITNYPNDIIDPEPYFALV